MDWKYIHFHQQAVFTAARQSILDAARPVMAESLGLIEETDEGFSVRGRSAWHNAIANFRISEISEGTQVAVELIVERVGGWRDYMLVDIGGYYDGQIRRWLADIGRQLGQQPVSMSRPSAGHGCLVGCLVYLFVGAGLAFCAIPLDRALFQQTPSSNLGPFTILASILGLSAGLIAFLAVRYPEAPVWKAIRERLRRFP